MHPTPLAIAHVALGAAILVAAPSAQAAHWPRHVVTYRNVTPWSGSVSQAADWINAMPGGITLRPASRGARANITLRAVDRPGVDWAGLTWTWAIGTRITRSSIELNGDWFAGDGSGVEARTARAEVTAHELLHALGLNHAVGCSIMQPTIDIVGDCVDDDDTDATVPCGPQRADAIELVARYGGSVAGFDGFTCDDPVFDDADDDVGEELAAAPRG